VESYPEVWACDGCHGERTYGVQVRPFGPYALEDIHRNGASLWCKMCNAATRHRFTHKTEGLPLAKVHVTEESREFR